ncbi:MAG: diaminopimelate epimerase [Kiloniellales bacterium]
MGGRSFIKMHGLGNDFVVVDARGEAFAPTPAQARAIADRRRGVGFDQLLVIEQARNGKAAAFMRIYNADGSESGACGNGARCVAALLMQELGVERLKMETAAGLLEAASVGQGRVAVDMGPASERWDEIPLAREMASDRLPLEAGPLREPVAVGLGNPHAVFFVEDASAVPLNDLGPKLERHPLFPERANIGVAQVTGKDRLRLRVWERGVGITEACGSGACAAAVAAARRGLTRRKVTVTLDGGQLEIEWRNDGHVVMSGPVSIAYAGVLAEELRSEELAS